MAMVRFCTPPVESVLVKSSLCAARKKINSCERSVEAWEMGVGNMYKKKVAIQGRCRSVVKESKKNCGHENNTPHLAHAHKQSSQLLFCVRVVNMMAEHEGSMKGSCSGFVVWCTRPSWLENDAFTCSVSTKVRQVGVKSVQNFR